MHRLMVLLITAVVSAGLSPAQEHSGAVCNSIGSCCSRKPADMKPVPCTSDSTAHGLRVVMSAEFDWREQGIMTPVKHQMNLGSCGVFAAVALFEALIKKESGQTVDLSEQQIVS